MPDHGWVQDSLEEQDCILSGSAKNDISFTVRVNLFKSAMIRVGYRRLSWAMQTIKEAALLKSYQGPGDLDQSLTYTNQMTCLTAQNLAVTLDKVLLIRIQNRLGDAFLRIKMTNRKKSRKGVSCETKIGLHLLRQLVMGRLGNTLSFIIKRAPKTHREVSCMDSLQTQISKYKTEISRLQSSHQYGSFVKQSNSLCIPRLHKQLIMNRVDRLGTISNKVSNTREPSTLNPSLLDIPSLDFRRKTIGILQ